MHDLHGSTLGLIGHGSVGAGVERLARAFGMAVLIAEHRGAAGIRPGRTPFDEVLARSDQISLHTPLTEATRGLIGAWELAGKNLYYTSKIGTGLTADQLHGVIFTTGEVADNLELELSPAKDEL